VFAGELILIGGELLDAAPYDGEINRHGFKLRLQFWRSDNWARRGSG